MPAASAGITPQRHRWFPLVVHENRQQNDDGQRDTDQPKQQSASESHDVLRICLLI
jgi:hypothetical protein